MALPLKQLKYRYRSIDLPVKQVKYRYRSMALAVKPGKYADSSMLGFIFEPLSALIFCCKTAEKRRFTRTRIQNADTPPGTPFPLKTRTI